MKKLYVARLMKATVNYSTSQNSRIHICKMWPYKLKGLVPVCHFQWALLGGCSWPRWYTKGWLVACFSSHTPILPLVTPTTSPTPPHMTHIQVHTQPEIEPLFLIHCYLVHMHNTCLIWVVIFRKYCLSLSVK